MNTKLIRKYKSVFLWLLEDEKNRTCRAKCNNNGVWGKHSLYSIFDAPEFEGFCVNNVVINDDYVKFRMAEADGVVVEGIDAHVCIWSERVPFSEFKYAACNYRIKPSTPEWADQLDGTFENGVICENENGRFGKITWETDVSDSKGNILCRPITPDDLHEWQRKGWVKVEEVIERIKCTYNWIYGERVIDWLERLK